MRNQKRALQDVDEFGTRVLEEGIRLGVGCDRHEVRLGNPPRPELGRQQFVAVAVA